MLPARHRLRDPADFRTVLRGPGAARAGGALLMVHVAMTDPRGLRSPRVGFAVSGAVGGSVVRHRVQRRLRHLMRDRLALLPPGLDVVIRAQPACASASSGQLGAELDRLLGRATAKVAR